MWCPSINLRFQSSRSTTKAGKNKGSKGKTRSVSRVLQQTQMLALENKIDENTAAIMIETIQGEGGIRPLSLKILEEIKKLCIKNKILLFLDEIQCGFGRSGKLFSYQWTNIEPDIMAVAKGIGSGFPMGACLATNDSSIGMTKGTHGTTCGGNPLAMAVGTAVINEIMTKGFLERVKDVSKYLWFKLKQLENDFDEILE